MLPIFSEHLVQANLARAAQTEAYQPPSSASIRRAGSPLPLAPYSRVSAVPYHLRVSFPPREQMDSTKVAKATWELENNIQDLEATDALFRYDDVQQKAVQQQKVRGLGF
jgi:hypothetical protein